jgi:hypothetical protein
MNSSIPIRKVYQGVADRHQMFRMFDRHSQRPDRNSGDAAAFYDGEWFEIEKSDHDYMLEIMPPLWMRGDMFALREFLTGTITSVFFSLHIDGGVRYFHGYCDLADSGSPQSMREAIIVRESRPEKAMTRSERIEHIWSAVHENYRSYAEEESSLHPRGARLVQVHLGDREPIWKPLDSLTDLEIAAKLPVHLRFLPIYEAA